MKYIEDFIHYVQFEKRYSAHTVLAYSADLKQFSDFCNTFQIIDPKQVTDKIIRSWMVELMESKISARSVNRKLSTLKTFYKHLLKEGKIDSSPLTIIVAPKIKKRLPVFIEESKMDTLLEDIDFDDGFKGIRNKMIIETFYFTGIRLTELINLEEKDIDTYNQSIKVLGKRNKERIVPLTNDFCKRLKEYIIVKNIELPDESVLFPRENGTKLYNKAVYKVVNNYLSLISSVEKKSPHVLRHTFATHMLNNGADLNAIKELLGHSNLSATQVYTHNTFEKLTKIYKQAHPRA
jgi:integrase/recombinase XerC